MINSKLQKYRRITAWLPDFKISRKKFRLPQIYLTWSIPFRCVCLSKKSFFTPYKRIPTWTETQPNWSELTTKEPTAWKTNLLSDGDYVLSFLVSVQVKYRTLFGGVDLKDIYGFLYGIRTKTYHFCSNICHRSLRIECI